MEDLEQGMMKWVFDIHIINTILYLFSDTSIKEIFFQFEKWSFCLFRVPPTPSSFTRMFTSRKATWSILFDNHTFATNRSLLTILIVQMIEFLKIAVFDFKYRPSEILAAMIFLNLFPIIDRLDQVVEKPSRHPPEDSYLIKVRFCIA